MYLPVKTLSATWLLSFIILSRDVVVQEEVLKDEPSAVDYDQQRQTGQSGFPLINLQK